MDIFREEIYKMIEFLFLCGERLLETESFILELTRRKNINFDEDWRKQIEEFLDEGKKYNCRLEILDKRTNVTVGLAQINPLKLRNLYMELAAHLDLDEEYEVKQTKDSAFYTITLSKNHTLLEERNSIIKTK